MPDSVSLRPKETVADLIRRHRRPLPEPVIDIENFRVRAVAICSAEVAHRSRDFQRVERALGLSFDRWLEPDCEQLGQFPHEAHAAAALLWLSHLQTHESEKRTPWSGVPFRSWRKDARTRWFAKRRTLWSGFLRQVERYRMARRYTSAALPTPHPEERSAEPRLEGCEQAPHPLPILRDGRYATSSG